MPPELPLPLIDAALRGAVFVLLLLLGAQAAREAVPRHDAGGDVAGHAGTAGPAADTSRRPRLAVAALLMCTGLAVQVPGSSPWAENHLGCAWQTPLIAVSVGNAVLFWLFSAALFDDTFRWRPWHFAVWLGAALIGGAQCVAFVHLEPGPVRLALRVALRAVTLLCLLAALWEVVRHWRTDLVEARRRLRLWLVGAGIVYTAVQLAARLSTPAGLLTPGLALLDIAVLGAVVGAWAFTALRLQGGGLLDGDVAERPTPPLAGTAAPLPGAAVAPPAELALPAAPVASAASAVLATADAARPTLRAEDRGHADAREPAIAPEAAAAAESTATVAAVAGAATNPDTALAAALQQAMETDRAYRDDRLSVASLAARLGVPEYRLRRHINRHLGFRNFNVYVNSYRLADARRWLADPAHGDAPILTIALDAGFGSIGPFNRAFKADTGLTPTEFRAQVLAGGAGQPREARQAPRSK